MLPVSGRSDDKLAEVAVASGADDHMGKWATTEAMRDAVVALPS